MISALEQRNYSLYTIRAYISHIEKLARHYRRDPQEISPDEIQSYLLGIIKQGKSFGHYRQIIGALRFLYCKILERGQETLPVLPYPRKVVRKIPKIPSLQEVEMLLFGAQSLKDKALIATLYGTGVRLFELCDLLPSDIDSKRMIVTIRKGKWDKTRLVPLPNSLLLLLRSYWREHKPKKYLFEGKPGHKITHDAVRKIVKLTATRAKLSLHINPRLLRHAFATHRYEANQDILMLQKLLGHSSILTTRFYTHVSDIHISQSKSPLDTIL